MKKRILYIALMLALMLGLSAVAAKPTASAYLSVNPTSSTVLVNGKQIAFESYNINGSNYFKLRDIAFVLGGTDKQFSVSWEMSTNTLYLTSGAPYRSVGSELTGRATVKRVVIQSTVKVIFDGAQANIRAYNIDGNNFFKLRDIGETVGFAVEWNPANNMIAIDTSKEYTPDYTPTRLEETADMGQEYLDSIIFLGDSTTYALLAYGVLSGGTRSPQVWTPANRTFSLFNQNGITILYPETGLNIKLEEAVSLKKPEYMIITLGINGVSSMNEDYFKSEYTALINRIRTACPDTKIILNTIYPVARNYNLISNAKISKGNEWIYSLAEELDLRFLDTASVLKDEDGYLRSAYQNGDGLHLSVDALKIVLDYIRTHGYR